MSMNIQNQDDKLNKLPAFAGPDSPRSTGSFDAPVGRCGFRKQRNTNSYTFKLPFLAVLAFALVLFLTGLGKRHLWDADEPRVAGIAAHMANSGDFVVPRLNGKPFLEKPPLYFWATSTAFSLFGQNNFSARLPSAISAIAGVLLVFFLTRKMGFSVPAASLSSLVLATSGEYWSIGRRCLVDMTLTFFITAAMACFYLAIISKKHWILWGLGFVVSLALGILSKGLIGMAIPAGAIVCWLILERNFSLRPWILFVCGSMLCFIPAALWIWMLCNDLGTSAVYDAMIANNFGRFTGDYAQHVAPFYYYLVKFPGQFMPWALFLPLTVVLLYKNGQISKKQNPSLFLLCWLLVPFILLSVAAGKRGLYLLPLYPAAAILVGHAISTVLKKKKDFTNWFTIPTSILTVTTIIVPIVFTALSIYNKQPVMVWPLVLIPGLSLGIWAYFRLSKKQFVDLFRILSVALLVIYVTLDCVINPVYNEKKSSEPLFEYCMGLKNHGIKLSLLSPKERLSGAAMLYLKSTIPEFRETEDMFNFLKYNEKSAVIAYAEKVQKLNNIEILKSFMIKHDTIVVAKYQPSNETGANINEARP